MNFKQNVSSHYLIRGKNNRLYFRMVVPTDIRPILKQREFRRSLKTSDVRVALPRAWHLADECHNLFRRCREMGLGIQGSICMANLTVIQNELPDGTITKKIIFDDDNVELEMKRYEAFQQVEEKLAQERSVRDNSSDNDSSEPGSPRRIRRKRGLLSDAVTETTPLLSKVVDQYIAEKTNNGSWSKNTIAENTKTYKKMVALLSDRPVDSVFRGDADELLSRLKKLPSKQTGGCLSVSTVNERIGMMSTLYRWAMEHQLCTYNPFKGLRKKKKMKRSDQARDAYTLSEIERLFDPTHFKMDKIRPARWWLPILMIHSSCRPSELAQLTVDDVLSIDGVPSLSINEEHQVKTDNAIRTIPIHSELIRLGFLRFADQQRNKLSDTPDEDRRLFPELSLTRAKPAGAVSSWWNGTHHKHCNVINKTIVRRGRVSRERRVSLYSLRHLVLTTLRNNNVPETYAAEIAGHEKGEGISYNRYAKSGELQPLVVAIEMLKFGDVMSKVPVWR